MKHYLHNCLYNVYLCSLWDTRSQPAVGKAGLSSGGRWLWMQTEFTGSPSRVTQKHILQTISGLRGCTKSQLLCLHKKGKVIFFSSWCQGKAYSLLIKILARKLDRQKNIAKIVFCGASITLDHVQVKSVDEKGPAACTVFSWIQWDVFCLHHCKITFNTRTIGECICSPRLNSPTSMQCSHRSSCIPWPRLYPTTKFQENVSVAVVSSCWQTNGTETAKPPQVVINNNMTFPCVYVAFILSPWHLWIIKSLRSINHFNVCTRDARCIHLQ